MLERLFVYGTLCPGRPNEHILADMDGTWLNATIMGTLEQKGWGAKMGYPGIVLNEDGGQVKGFVFSSDNLSNNWQMLDDFEGQEYQRVLTKAKLNNGNLVDVSVYVLRSSKELAE